MLQSLFLFPGLIAADERIDMIHHLSTYFIINHHVAKWNFSLSVSDVKTFILLLYIYFFKLLKSFYNSEGSLCNYVLDKEMTTIHIFLKGKYHVACRWLKVR